MAALVADGWAGAENLEKQFCDGRTDGRTDGPTDRKVAYRVACPRLKRGEMEEMISPEEEED